MDLYRYVPPLEENIYVSIESFPIYGLVPTEDDIKWSVTGLRSNRYRGPSEMRTEHLKGWLAAARKKKREVAATKKEHLPEEMTTKGPYGIVGGRRRTRSGRRRLRRLLIGRRWWRSFIQRSGRDGLQISSHGRQWY